MKFSEEILEQFDIEPPVDHEPVNVMKIRDMLGKVPTVLSAKAGSIWKPTMWIWKWTVWISSPQS